MSNESVCAPPRLSASNSGPVSRVAVNMLHRIFQHVLTKRLGIVQGFF